MNLIIDVGNTLVKLAVFDNEILTIKRSCVKVDFISTLEELSNTYPKINDVIISSVGDFSEKEILFIQKNQRYLVYHYCLIHLLLTFYFLLVFYLMISCFEF